ncbi:MAG: hypothetical protein J1F22_02755 [Lachnospiraceae bacterium]|nr:hypothetical protein [Lachnospiraceae bacterium]
MAELQDAKKKKKKKKEVIVLTPEEKYAQLLALKKATRCILEIDEKYKIYVRLTKEFAELGRKAEENPFEGSDQCMALSEECRAIAEEMEKELPPETEEESQTVTTTAKEREGKEKGGKGKWLFFAAIALVVIAIVCYKAPPTRYLIAGAEKTLGMDKLSKESYYKLGDYKDSEEKGKQAAYDYALSLEEKGNYIEAAAEFGKLAPKGYADSEQKEAAIEQVLFSEAELGKPVTFGKYQWLVLENREDTVLLAKAAAIEDLAYHDKAEKTKWETCSLRRYLNEEFLQETFTAKEQELIQTKSSTQDKLFILDKSEVEEYQDILKEKTHHLRLRDSGAGKTTAFTTYRGEVVDEGFPVEQTGVCVRPVMWVKKK